MLPPNVPGVKREAAGGPLSRARIIRGPLARLEGMRIEEPAGILGCTPFHAAARRRFRLGQPLRVLLTR